MKTAPIDGQAVARAHDAMAEEYDRLNDLWYPWLFSRIHWFAASHLRPMLDRRPTGLDAGCGTGFQSFLLAQAGCEVTGVDLSPSLLDVARAKAPVFSVPPLEAPPLFASESWPGLEAKHRRLAQRLEELRGGRDVVAPAFAVADLTTYDFGTGGWDVIVCCGSVLSFIDSYSDVVAKMARGLRAGGVLILEVEQRYNLDLIWPAVDRLLGGRLGYEQEWGEIWRNLVAPPGRSVRVNYPFELLNGDSVVLPIWVFSIGDLGTVFRSAGLRVFAHGGVHWATNLVPSTLLHAPHPGPALSGIARGLALVDGLLGGLWPAWRLGCSVLYALSKP